MTRYLNNDENEAVTSSLVLPFPFTFFGTLQSSYWVTSNGALGFGPLRSVVTGARCPLPDTFYSAPLIFGFNDDLQSRSGASYGICIAARGAAPNRALVATWREAKFFETGAGRVTFSLTLHETTNEIDVVFQTLEGPGPSHGETAAVGVQNYLMPATSFNCAEGLVTPQTRIRFLP
jgi:hypothetical protein